jgi:hypothetical protein
LFGAVASVATARRVMVSLGPGELAAIRRARAVARQRAWQAGAAPQEVVLDFDAFPIGAHSEKEGAAGHYKGGFGHHLRMPIEECRSVIIESCRSVGGLEAWYAREG